MHLILGSDSLNRVIVGVLSLGSCFDLLRSLAFVAAEQGSDFPLQLLAHLPVDVYVLDREGDD